MVELAAFPGASGASGSDRPRTRIVVVGLGMVTMSFMEKLMKRDAKRHEYSIVVTGEELHLAYNRVGLSTFFEHRQVEQLYLNPPAWYTSSAEDGTFNYHLNTRVTAIDRTAKHVTTSAGHSVHYDILVLTGAEAVVPAAPVVPAGASGVFVYRRIADLEEMIRFAQAHAGTVGVAVGGGLLGLEAAKAMLDMASFSSVAIIDRNAYLLARQLDADAGRLVTEGVRALGLDVMHHKRIASVLVDADNNVSGVLFEDGEKVACSAVCFAIGVRPRDDLAATAGIETGRRTGGFIIDERLQTSVPDIYAVGDCVCWQNQTFGIIAPGIEMADVLSFNLTEGRLEGARVFDRPDLSTKLKLLGIDVASFGDFFADRDGPKSTVAAPDAADGPRPAVKAITYKDPFGGIYKKYLFADDGKRLVGGMMIGDTRDYAKLTQMVRAGKVLDVPPSEFILGAQKEGEDDGSDLTHDTQICLCHNVTKGDVVEAIQDGTCKDLGGIKRCTKAGTGCGGCVPLVQIIINRTLQDMGQEVSQNSELFVPPPQDSPTHLLCHHFPRSRADLYNIVAVKQLKTFAAVMGDAGYVAESLGCEICKPAVASILASVLNEPVLSRPHHDLQDTNDRFLANIQRNGTFSVVPRVPGGEIRPKHLITMGQVAEKYGLHCKITGGQRIDMFGARKQDLLAIWQDLVDAGMESGHAYAKALRTVKSCVGSTWCRFGVGDSVGMAIRIEERYKSIRAPHKFKGGVSGCVRECAEAQSKDFGLIATEHGYNIYVGGNGGAKPRHAELLAKDVAPEDVIPILDRFVIFYIRTAERLQRTARWIESLPGGLDYLKEVILEDCLGICADMEKQMQGLVEGYFCEWTEILADPARQTAFRQFDNTDQIVETVEPVVERAQTHPAYWAPTPATEDFRGYTWSSVVWVPVIETSHFEAGGRSSAQIKHGDTQLAVFRVRGRYYATQQMCPHKRAFVLSDSLVGEAAPAAPGDDAKYWISCPYHKRNFDLNGAAPGQCDSDPSLSVATFAAEARGDAWVYLQLPPAAELDALLGTVRWKTRRNEARDPFEQLDRKLNGCQVGRRGRRPQAASGGEPTVLKTTTISW
ncbi:hypothetical protein SCUCBS95973_006947 [Sporothrix curviconia]|uniref:Rieske domain-containing protein n=1 Tax=Sporothrix curviconia TaxID=1260050 RepID=A0ABP0C9D7_9PEZI